MNRKTKYIIYIMIVILVVSFAFYFMKKFNKNFLNDNNEDFSNVVTEDSKQNFLLERYPIDEVPLYKLREISSNKFFINSDPVNVSTFGDKNFSYYNVVLYTDSSQSEFINYYKDLFDEEVVEEYPIPDMVKGYIGKYRVTAAHYGSEDTAYIQVYLPKNEFTKENIYFDSYPNLFESDAMFVENENSYGLLNQLGGQIEYTKYFTVIDSGDQNEDGLDDVNEFSVLIEKSQSLYEQKPEYSYDSENSLMSWKEEGYSVKVSFSREHGRIYLNMRGNMDK